MSDELNFSALTPEEQDAINKKAMLQNTIGGIGQALANQHSAGEYFLGQPRQNVEIQQIDPIDYQKKAMLNKYLIESRDPNSEMSKRAQSNYMDKIDAAKGVVQQDQWPTLEKMKLNVPKLSYIDLKNKDDQFNPLDQMAKYSIGKQYNEMVTDRILGAGKLQSDAAAQRQALDLKAQDTRQANQIAAQANNTATVVGGENTRAEKKGAQETIEHAAQRIFEKEQKDLDRKNAIKLKLLELQNKDKMEKLPLDVKQQVDVLSKANGNLLKGRNAVKDVYDKIDTLPKDQQIVAFEGLLKTMNDPQNSDAVGMAEAQRLMPFVENHAFNFFGPGPKFGRDLKAAKQQLGIAIDSYQNRIKKNNEDIQSLINNGGSVSLPQQNVPINTKSPPNGPPVNADLTKMNAAQLKEYIQTHKGP